MYYEEIIKEIFGSIDGNNTDVSNDGDGKS